jgi:hypothetical protein
MLQLLCYLGIGSVLLFVILKLAGMTTLRCVCLTLLSFVIVVGVLIAIGIIYGDKATPGSRIVTPEELNKNK